jgi:hypothetical protein
VRKLILVKHATPQAIPALPACTWHLSAARQWGMSSVIAHGTVITLFVAYYMGLPALPLWQRLGLPSFVVLTLPGCGLAEVVEDVAGALC